MPNPLTLANPSAVPGTGRHSRYRWFRAPRHASVKRALLAACGTLRGVSVPPSAWDDLTRGCERSWKRHRATRWH